MREAPLKTTAYQQAIVSTSTKKKERIGTLRILEDGRKFRYAFSGAAISAGTACSSRSVVADHKGAPVSLMNTTRTQAEVTVTAGTAVAENFYSGGYVRITAGVGSGRTFRIDSNTAVDSSGTSIVVTLTDRFPEIDGTTRVDLVPSIWNGVGSAAAGDSFAGIAPVDVESGRYFWAQTGGPVLATASGNISDGAAVSTADDGAVRALTVADGTVLTGVVGICSGYTAADGEAVQVMLTVD